MFRRINMFSKFLMLAHLAHWRLTWNRRNTHYRFTLPSNDKFMGPRDAVKLIRDGDVIATSGLGSSQWPSILYWAIREVFQETGHPRDLTVLSIGGQGGRGVAPGSIEEMGLEGLTTRFFAGHIETFKSMLRLADSGHLELQCIPQGPMAFLIDGQGRGEESLLTSTGVGTFADPRVGRGTPVADPNAKQWVEVEDGKLRFSMPKINVALFNAPAADHKGNIYVKHCAMVAESREIVRAARKNGGTVIANVAHVVDEGYDEVFLPGEDIDAIVPYPNTYQVGSVPQRRYWPMFTLDADVPLKKSIDLLRFVNKVLGITPRRSAVDNALARLAASLFAEYAPKGSLVNIGVGLPEEVCRLIVEAGLFDDVEFFTESGVVGGLPAPGVFFGAGVCPKEMRSSTEMFRRIYERLDVSILGVLQADSHGNVNVSNRGAGAINYVGPGGFIDFSTQARTVIFVCSWMLGAKIVLRNGEVRVLKPGKAKFVEQVDEVTFNGARAVTAQQNILFATNVGAFRLTERGMELICVMPGIDVQKDIIDACQTRIVLPDSGKIPVVDASVVTGDGFTLSLRERQTLP
ncbi:MAG: hypothetical protein GWP08_12350 [Nitrospiraceae bacterium]|nr:hypothetical protein [Nitrospiraceae bacterium]